MALLLGVTLSGATLHGYLSAQALAQTVARGQAEDLLQRSRPPHVGRAEPPTQAELAEVLGELEPRGLRYLGMVGEQGKVLFEAGSPSGVTEMPRPGTVVFVGNIARATAPPPPPPPPPPRADGPPRPPTPSESPRVRGAPLGDVPPPLPRPGAGEHPPPHGRPLQLVIEFEPTIAIGLIERSRVSFIISLVVAGVLMLVAIVLWRQLRVADRAATTLSKQRHLAALGEMSAVLAHEIRNPLAALKGHAQLLSESLPDAERPRERAEVVVNHAVRLEQLTNELLEFARTGEVTRTPTDPRALLRSAAQSFDDPRLELALDRAPDTWPLDGPRMDRVVHNLLSNALQASSDEARVEVTLTATATELELTVRDHGTGLPDGEENRVFEAFHSKRIRGTGLGLAVVQRIVELHGGHVGAHNAPGGGALFRVTIPAD